MKRFKLLLLNLLLFPVFGGFAIPGEGAAEEDTGFEDFFTEAANAATTGDPAKPDKPEPEKVDEEKLAAEKVESERLAAEKAEAEKAEAERVAAEKLAAVKTTAPTAEEIARGVVAAQEKAAAEKAAADKAEAERLERERATEPSDEEKAAEAQFRKDWPDHAAALDKHKAEIESLKKLVTDTLAAVNGKVDPLIATTQEQLDQEHYDSILKAHPDAEDKYSELVAWVDKQPAYLRGAYNEVLQNGTSTEVIDVYTAFKKDTGKTTTDPAAEKAERERAEKEQADAERKKALHLAAPSSRRSAVSGAIDENDFDAAFAEAAKEAAQKSRAA